MKKLLILVCTVPLLAACDGRFIKDEFLSSECLEAGERLTLEGYTITAIHYGDSRMIVLPISKIHANSEFRFKLIPDKKKSDEFNWEDAWVEISSDDDDADTPPNWLDAEGSHAANDGWLVACVPDIAPGRKIKYKVSVSKAEGEAALGLLDPRAVVIPN
ncbi:MAG: hypothetical protein P8Y01_10250 [Woeseiaceae bacterium]|jgi:hypothetical protein